MLSCSETWYKFDSHRKVLLFHILFTTRNTKNFMLFPNKRSRCSKVLKQTPAGRTVLPLFCMFSHWSLSVYTMFNAYTYWLRVTLLSINRRARGNVTSDPAQLENVQLEGGAFLLVNIVNHSGLLSALKRGEITADTLIRESIYFLNLSCVIHPSCCRGSNVTQETQHRLKKSGSMSRKCETQITQSKDCFPPLGFEWSDKKKKQETVFTQI